MLFRAVARSRVSPQGYLQDLGSTAISRTRKSGVSPIDRKEQLLRLHQRRYQRISALVSIFIRVVQYTYPGETCAHGQRQENRHG